MATSYNPKIPIIVNPPTESFTYPGRVGTEKPKRKLTAIKPPPKERAMEVSQKEKILETLMVVWQQHPYLRLGQLLTCIASDSLSTIEDFTLAEAMENFNPSDTFECGILSHSRTFHCTLEKGHSGDEHFSCDLGLTWRQF